jgi:universal stress protein E
MAKQLQHILVAIGSLKHAPKKELHKAAVLAKAAGASLELFHVIDQPDPGRSYPETATLEGVQKERAAIVAKCEARLQRFACDPSLRGVELACAAVWDAAVDDAIVRRALATKADLVIVATQGHRFGARFVLRNTDWELIRHCPVPLLLVKSRRPYYKPVILAAVDPFHAHAKPADLDARLLRAAAQFSHLLNGTTHVFHAYMPLLSVDTVPLAGVPPVMLPPVVEEAHGEQVARVVNRLAQNAGIPRTRRHIHMGVVSDELGAVTRRTGTALVVMGAVSRSALARFFIGNTAERVLDKISCDVLIVKPRVLGTKVAPTPSARKGRRSESAAVQPPESDSTFISARDVLPPLF